MYFLRTYTRMYLCTKISTIMIFLSKLNSYFADRQHSSLVAVSLVQLSVGNDTIVENVTGRKVDGKWWFFGVEELLRSYMQTNSKKVVEVTYSFVGYDGNNSQTNANSTVKVLYNDAKVAINSVAVGNCDGFAAKRYLNAGKLAWLTPDSYIDIWYVDSNDEGQKEIHYRDGTSEVVTITEVQGEVHSCRVSYDATAEYVTVSFHYRPDFTVYMLPDYQEVEFFQFLDIFNCWEQICIPCAITSEPKTEFDTAQQDNITLLYDVVHSVEFSVKTPVLPAFMYERLLAFCRARKVMYRMGVTNGFVYVYITEYKLIKSNEPNTPVRLEMKFKYTDIQNNDALIVV